MRGTVYFITGIDTDIGKTVCTGLLAKYLLNNNRTVITQKLVQTGCRGISEDILRHRKIMGIELTEDDLQSKTCRYVFTKPCSPHLAAELEKREIDCGRLTEDTEQLRDKYSVVLLEGAGGLYAPLTREIASIDYVVKNAYPLVIVSSSRLGSLNHTLGLIELCSHRRLEIAGLLYNRFAEQDDEIGRDSRQVITESLKKMGFNCPVLDVKDTAETEELECGMLFT